MHVFLWYSNMDHGRTMVYHPQTKEFTERLSKIVTDVHSCSYTLTLNIRRGTKSFVMVRVEYSYPGKNTGDSILDPNPTKWPQREAPATVFWTMWNSTPC